MVLSERGAAMRRFMADNLGTLAASCEILNRTPSRKGRKEDLFCVAAALRETDNSRGWVGPTPARIKAEPNMISWRPGVGFGAVGGLHGGGKRSII